ncbi:MAG: sulfur carrier protein ThiS [Gemmatimonadetes bacterium]|jgi:sulfur carrier protein|nr:sulfur carrier protein ThiS [Gemmatimonadota bacterium]
MKVEVNGKSREFVAGGSVLALLVELEIDPRMVVVERNREIVRRDDLDRIEVEDGDQFEIVQFVGGG